MMSNVKGRTRMEAVKPSTPSGPTPARANPSATTPVASIPRVKATFSTRRCLATSSDPRPATSCSHGPAHSPCRASPEPIAAMETGATRQKSRSRKMRPRPARVSRNESARPSRSVSWAGTTIRMRNATPAVTTARNWNTVRQEVQTSAISTGVVAAMVPRPPKPMMRPFSTGHLRRGNQTVMALNEAMSPPAKPIPTRARPRVRSSNDRAVEKMSAPPVASRRRANCTRRGP